MSELTAMMNIEKQRLKGYRQLDCNIYDVILMSIMPMVQMIGNVPKYEGDV